MIQMIKSLNSKTVIQIIILILYKVFLDYIYKTYVSVEYYRYGFRNISNIKLLIVMWMVWFIFIYFAIRLMRQKTVSSLILLVFIFLYLAPLNTFCSFNNVEYSFAIVYVMSALLLLILFEVSPTFDREIDYRVNVPDYFVMILFFSLSVFIVYVSWRYSGFRIYGINDSIYNIRAQASKVSMPKIIGYIWSNVTYFLVFFIIYSFMKKKYWMLPIVAVLGYVVFSFAAHKSLLVILFIVFLGCIFWKKEYKYCISVGFLINVLVCSYEYLILCSEKIANLAVRRMMFDQSIISYNTYSFFRYYPLDYFRQRFMHVFGETSVYKEYVARIIGERVFSSECNANSGFLSDIFTNTGYIGIIIIPISFVILLKLLDFATRGIEMKYLIGISIYYAMLIGETPIGTLLFSHGFILTIVLFLLIPKEERMNSNDG